MTYTSWVPSKLRLDSPEVWERTKYNCRKSNQNNKKKTESNFHNHSNTKYKQIKVLYVNDIFKTLEEKSVLAT